MREGENIPIRNIFHMLAYAYRALRQEEYKRLASEDFSHVHDLFAAILAIGVGRQLKQGLYREYVGRLEELATLRGKVDVAGTVRARLARRRIVACEYDELSENNMVNQAIKATMLLLVRHGKVSAKRKALLRQELVFFSGVDDADISVIRWYEFRFMRLSQSYQMLVSMCRFVAEGMLLSSRSGEHRLAQFIDDQQLHRLYEKFILEYYREEHRELKASSPQIAWALNEGEKTMLPVMQSDVVLSRGNGELVIDAKFYAHTTRGYYGARTIHSANLYQIFTYVKNRDAACDDGPRKVSGLLLYARTYEPVQLDESYVMSGSPIGVRTLDLSVEFSQIAGQLDEIARDYFGEEGSRG